MKLVTGSETGIDTAVPYVDYFEGMMSLAPYRLPDAGRNMADIVAPTPDILKFQVGVGYRIPLWELVYHDCVVSYWYWGDYNNKMPEVWDRRDLFDMLYGVPPVFMLDQKLWDRDKDKFAASYHRIGPLARELACDEMLTHAFITADHTVQETTWRSGTRVFVNFGSIAYKLANGDELAPLSCRVLR